MATSRQPALIPDRPAVGTLAYEPVVRAEEIARMLDCSVKTILRKAKAGEIPAVQIGKLWRFRKSAIDSWFEERQKIGGTNFVGAVDSNSHPRVSHQEGKN